MKKKTVSQLKKELDRLFSLYIRNKYAKAGYVRCFTCGVVKLISNMQCGHFVSRAHLATRYDEENVRPQCVGCNVFGGGKTAVFADNLERKSPGIVAALYRKARQIVKNFPYEEKIKEYKEKLKQYE